MMACTTQMSATRSFLVALAMCSTVTLGSSARAEVLLDFDTAADYTGNFVQMRNTGSQMAWSGANGPDAVSGIVSGAHSSSVSQFRYDSNLATAGRDEFLTETIEVDLRPHNVGTTALSGTSSHGIFLRVQESNNLGVLALVSYLSNTSIRVRMGYGAELTTGGSGIGTQFWDATFDLSAGTVANGIGTGGTAAQNGITSAGWLHFVIGQSDADLFNLTVSDVQGLVLSTGDVALAARTDLGHTEANVAPYRNAGSVGFRINNGGGNTMTAGIDNFSIVPEPASLALMGLGSLLIASRRRHASGHRAN